MGAPCRLALAMLAGCGLGPEHNYSCQLISGDTEVFVRWPGTAFDVHETAQEWADACATITRRRCIATCVPPARAPDDEIRVILVVADP